MMTWFRLSLALLFAVSAVAEPLDPSWKKAQPGYVFEFPKDEFSHPDFKTEWWYFTGNLTDRKTGRPFGYQLTFFRSGLRAPALRKPTTSRFVVDSFWFAHFAVSDLEGKTFHASEELTRGAFDEAGSQDGQRIVWLNDWELQATKQDQPGFYELKAEGEDAALTLKLETTKPPVFQGDAGFSSKSADGKSASHYYSFTRLSSEGTLRLGDREFEVAGTSWYDREWSTSLLDKNQIGWDWFAIQLEDGRDLMLFQLRNPDGSTNFGSGTFVETDGTTRRLFQKDFTLQPTKNWLSPTTKASYPTSWDIKVPELDLDLQALLHSWTKSFGSRS